MRNITLDLIRTLAIVLMVVFHFIYDLRFFSYLTWDIPDGNGWLHFRWLIVSLFFLCLGISLTFTHKNKFRLKKFISRFSQIAACACIISIASYLAIPDNWIFFGVLHFLAFSSLIVVGLVRFPVLCLLIAIAIFAFASLQILPSRWPFNVLFYDLPHYTNDYVAIFPWLGMVFFGVPLAHWYLLNNDPLKPLLMDRSARIQKLALWPGQHSLSIYVIHQPLLMSGFYLISKI